MRRSRYELITNGGLIMQVWILIDDTTEGGFIGAYSSRASAEAALKARYPDTPDLLPYPDADHYEAGGYTLKPVTVDAPDQCLYHW